MSTRLQALRLFFLGFLTLFLELVLIRYLAGSIWNLGYFPNLVLIGVFVGMGVGFVFHQYWSDQHSQRLFFLAPFLLLMLIIFVMSLRPSLPGFAQSVGDLGGDLYFTSSPRETELQDYPVFAVWFLSIVIIFALISQRTAKIFRQFAPLTAYTLDISGSCCGILGFMAMSWLTVPAWFWFLFLIPLFTLGAEETQWKRMGITLAILVLCAGLAGYGDMFPINYPSPYLTMKVKWSPYQKVEYITARSRQHRIFVNGVGHQHMALRENLYGPTGRDTPYWLPYELRLADLKKTAYKKVLVLGSGAGNDVASALLYGAEQVDAVEIDPVIAEFGKNFHPVGPYQDKRANLIIDDGRAFLARTDQRYDLIIFALTDSLVKVSPMAQLRLENYLFTEEAVKKAYSLLNDGGDLLFYNFYRRRWLVDKLAQMIFNVSGKFPHSIFQRQDFVMFMVNNSPPAKPNPKTMPIQLETPTDDWPFLYLKQRGIPSVYLWAMLFLTLLIFFLMGVLQIAARRRREGLEAPFPIKLAFAFMGIAFLLLETKSVIQFSLLFGTTWLNNSLVFLAILLLVLLANWTALMLKSRALYIVYILLLFSCVITLVFPLAELLRIENVITRFVLASLMTFAPIFFANLIFSITFRYQKVPEHVFGWNLLGATLGGALEYTSLAFGYNALAILVLVCYTLVICFLMIGHSWHGKRPSISIAYDDSNEQDCNS